MKGFLGTGATFGADANLIVQAAMGAALLAGTYLARRRSYTAHGICQTTVMLLNLVMITLVMWPSFQRQVTPALPAHLGDRYYAVGTAHAALGIAAELFGLYIRSEERRVGKGGRARWWQENKKRKEDE